MDLVRNWCLIISQSCCKYKEKVPIYLIIMSQRMHTYKNTDMDVSNVLEPSKMDTLNMLFHHSRLFIGHFFSMNY